MGRSGPVSADDRTDAAEVYPVVPVHPDHERPADQVLLRHEAPETAVRAAVAIVSHREIMAGRHLPAALVADPGVRDLEDTVFDVAELLLQDPGVAEVAPGFGRTDIIAEIGFRNLDAVH